MDSLHTELIDTQNGTETIIIQTVGDEEQVSPQIHIGKPHVMPFVYIQSPSKITTMKSNANNVILNTMPQVKLANMPQTTKITPTAPILLGKQQIIIQKPQNAHKNGGMTYVLKPMNKTAETNVITANRLPITAINKFNPETLKLINSTAVSQPAKILISPMPKVTSNRLPVTATTNSVQPKISFMPLTLPTTNNKNKVFNFTIADGKIQSHEKLDSTNLICNEMLDMEKDNNKSYQISIPEDSNSLYENSYTITMNDDQFESPKLVKHGVSILKKSYNIPEKKPVETETPVSDNITPVSDVKADQPAEEVAVPVKSRRKATILLRKDFDEDCKSEVETKAEKVEKKKAEKVKAEKVKAEKAKFEEAKAAETKVEEEEKIEEKVKEDKNELQFEFEDSKEVMKLLEWDNGLGTVPTTDIKFQVNEFGFLEYLTPEELEKLGYKTTKVIKEEKLLKRKREFQEEMRCLECGCFGLPCDFINPKFCSLDCQKNSRRDLAMKMSKGIKHSSRFKIPQLEFLVRNGNHSSDGEEGSTDTSSDKFNYPWHCNKKGFSWAKYLDHLKAKAAPVKLFKDPFPYNRNGFRPGMKLEGIDPQHQSYFCVLTVAESMGYRVRLHLDGYPENYDFWVNADCMDIFPVGFCEKYGHPLVPPHGIEKKDFYWMSYLKQTRSPMAPKHLFANRTSHNAIFPNGFRTGMKLEAVDRKNSSLVCVATITDMLNNRILVHFDSWGDIYDYWADPTSPYIHPVGWCDKNGHKLTPPNDYPNPESFTWERYLKETKSVAAPVRAFKQRPASGFKKGMRLECVDKRVPQLVRVASIDEVKGHKIRISFDGWPDKYSYWVDDDSTDIHPVGWCIKTGHPIESPLTPDDVYDFLECPTVGCRGLGHVMGPAFHKHTTQDGCPYADENLELKKRVPDRLQSPTHNAEDIIPFSRDPQDKKENSKGRKSSSSSESSDDSDKSMLGRSPKHPRLEEDEIKEEFEDDDEKELMDIEEHGVTLSPEIKSEPKTPITSCLSVKVKKEEILLDFVNPEEMKMRERHMKYLTNIVKCDKNPQKWTFEDVHKFVTSLPRCGHFGKVFSKNKIDGNSLLMLSQQDLIDILDFKLGPAITLYNCILILRKAVNGCT